MNMPLVQKVIGVFGKCFLVMCEVLWNVGMGLAFHPLVCSESSKPEKESSLGSWDPTAFM
jgi:hypothetical protein